MGGMENGVASKHLTFAEDGAGVHYRHFSGRIAGCCLGNQNGKMSLAEIKIAIEQLSVL